MSKETNVKVIDTTPNEFPAFVRLADIKNSGTTLILQRYLCTHIETTINRDEAVALSKALLQHFTISVDDLQSPVKPHIDIVYGPQGCGKTKHSNAIGVALNASRVIEGDDFGALSLAVSMIGSVQRIVMLTNVDGNKLFSTKETLIGKGFDVQIHSFTSVMRNIQKSCDHN